ncbi:MAG: TauD/TfdA dioxygenase family protein [Candidatus Puniceispirillaceae bacterium]
MRSEKISPALGAIIYDIDISQPLSNAEMAEIRALWLEHIVIVIRDQTLTPQQQLDFATCIGSPQPYPLLNGLDGFDMITPVLKREDETVNFGGLWHSDTTYQPQPPMATMLHARELPPIGGDTLFSNQYRAYETLSEGMKEALRGLKVVCISGKGKAAATRVNRIAENGANVDEAQLVGIHPVVRTHPETGRKALFVNEGHASHFEGWTSDESAGLLSYLYQHIIREEFQCRLVWKTGDVALWDNRCVLHYPVNDYHGYRRLLHRITLAGDVPR